MMACFQISCLLLVLIQIQLSDAVSCPCSYTSSVCADGSNCCDLTRMMGTCLRGENDDFTQLFQNKKPSHYWRLDEKDITNAMLSSQGYSISAQATNVINNGVQNKALHFTGIAGYKIDDSMSSCISNNSSRGLTLSLWLKYGNKTGQTSQTFFTIGEDESTEGGDLLQISQPNITKEEIGVLSNTNGKGSFFLRFPCPWNIWSHIAVSWNKQDSVIIIYRNGVAIEDAYYDICFGCNTTHGYKTYIGENDNNKAPNATMDEIALWCTDLNSTEVNKVYRYFKGPASYFLIMNMEFKDAASKTGNSDKIKGLVPTANVGNPDCSSSEQLKCVIKVTIPNEDGDASTLIIQGLGAEVKDYFTTIVPKTDVIFEAKNIKQQELEVHWKIDDDKDYSIFQYYNISYYTKTTPQDVKYIGYERYDLMAKITNLTGYTEYDFTIKQYFLGDVYKSKTINITTAEMVPGPPQNVESITINSTCIKLQWKNPLDPIGGMIRSFQISYALAETPTSQIGMTSLITSQQPTYDKEVCNLSPNTKYSFNVTGVTIAPGTSSDVVGYTRGEAPSVIPGNVISHNATAPHDDTSTCTIQWDSLPVVDSKGNLTSYRITFVKEGGEEQHAEVGVCNTTKVLYFLDHYSKYAVTVAVTNANGMGPYSEPVYCFTEGLVPTAPPANFSTIGKTSTSCLVSWDQVPKESQNGLILGYNITYNKIGDPDTNLKYEEVTGELTKQFEIIGLGKFTEYNITITAYTNKGMGNESSFVHGTCMTKEDAPDGVPENFAVADKTNVSCSISWTAIPQEKANGIIKGYEITGNDTNNTDILTNVLPTFITCDVNATFKDLQPFRIYQFYVLGFNSIAMSNKSEPLLCMTAEGPPLMPPPNLRCIPLTSRSLEVCWDEIPVMQQQGIIRNYIVQAQLLNNSASAPPSSVPSIGRCHNVTGLEEYSLYSLRVKGVTVLEGNFSETPIECMTKEGVPTTPPTNVQGNNITAYSLWVSWGDLEQPPPGILRHFVIYWRVWNASEETTKNVTVLHTTKYYVIENLELFTTYCVRVAGYTVGVGLMSDCTYITTDDKWLPPPDGIPEHLYQMTNSTTRNCSIEWSKSNNSNPDPDGRVMGYSIFYRFYGTNNTWEEVKVDGVNTTNHVLQNLEEYSIYVIRVAGFNRFGVGNMSIELLCKTKEDAPSLAPPNVTGINSSSTSLSISWGEIPTQDRNGLIREYKVIIYEKGRKNETIVILIVPVFANSHNRAQRRRRAIAIDPNTKEITGLKKYTMYAIQVYGVTISEGPLSPVIYVSTAEDVTTAPVTNLTVVNSSSTSLFMTWSNVPPEHVPGIIRYFVVYYWKTDWPIVEMKNVTIPIDAVRIHSVSSSRRRRRSVDVEVPDTAEFKFNLTGLQIWTNFTIQATAYTIGPGARTNETTVSTDEDRPCDTPSNIVFDIPQFTSLEVKWGQVPRECRNGIIRGYRLTYQELNPGVGPVTVNLTADQYNYTIEKMNMEVNYTISVLAYTRKGDGNATFDLARPDKMGPKHAPINVTAENFTTPTSIPVSWKPIEDPGVLEKLMGYRIAWTILSEGLEDIEEGETKHDTVRKDSLGYTIKGLRNFVRFRIEVSGFTRAGNGPTGITFASTCRCFRRIATNYRVFAPYNSVQISPDLKKVNISGMIPAILNNLTVDCCQTCASHGSSFVDFIENGHNKSAFQHNEMDVVSRIDDSNDLSFPIYGWKWQNRYQEIYRYIPLVESPGFAFLLLEPKSESPLREIVRSIIGTWPYLLITCIMALVAGIIIWFLDTAYNEEQFPHSYFKGIANGWWWAFISMTTLGYGDKVPAHNSSKAFAVVWVLTGLVIYGILSGSICTAFTTVIYEAKTNLYGSEVAAIYKTPEYRFGVRRGAKVNTIGNYTRFDEILDALMNKEVNGILMDTYEAGTKADEFKVKGAGRIRIQKVYDYSSTFGVVLAGPSTRLYQCSREWMSANRAMMSTHIAKYMGVVEEESINELVEIATGLFDKDSPTFQNFLKYSLMGYGVLLVLGLIWEFYRYANMKKKNKLESASDAFCLKTRLTQELGGFTRTYLETLMEKISDLRQKHKKEQMAFLRINRHVLRGTSSHTNLLPLQKLFRNDSVRA